MVVVISRVVGLTVVVVAIVVVVWTGLSAHGSNWKNQNNHYLFKISI